MGQESLVITVAGRPINDPRKWLRRGYLCEMAEMGIWKKYSTLVNYINYLEE